MTGLVEIARPGFLWAGVLLAGIPLLLHLLRPRERKPRLLPTTRFLTRDARQRIRVLTRPDHPPLLALRMGLCLLLGAALAGVSWTGPSQGSVEIVVAAIPPTGHPDAPAMEETLARIETRARIAEAEAVEIVRVPTDPDEPLQLAHLLRALRDHAGQSAGTDSLSARLVARPSWEAWGPGTLELRDHLWPGRISLEIPPRLEPGPADDPPTAPRTPPAVDLVADPELLAPVTRALELLGLIVHHPPGSTPDSPTPSTAPPAAEPPPTDPSEDPAISPEVASSDPPPPIHLRVGEGHRLGDLWIEGPRPARPDETDAPTGAGVSDPHFLLLDGRVIRGAGALPGGTPGADTKVPLLRAGGTPAAAARFRRDSVLLPEEGSDAEAAARCTVALPLAADAPVLGSGELPLLLDALLRESCPGALTPASDPGLEAGAEEAWRRLLEGGQRPGRVEAAPLRYDGAGFPLTRLLLALALVVALGEMALARQIEARAPAPAPAPPEPRSR